MKIIKLATITALTILSCNAYAIQFGGTGGRILDHHQTISPGLKGTTRDIPYQGLLKGSSSTSANITGLEGFVNMSYNLQGIYSYSISNSDNQSHVYEIECKTSTSDNKEIDDVWHVEVNSKGTASNSSSQSLAVMYESPGTWTSYAQIWIRGQDESYDSDSGMIDIRKM